MQPQQTPPGQSQPQATPGQQPPVQPAQPVYAEGQDYSIEYLDQIAPPTKKSLMPSKLILIILGLVGLLVIVGLFVMLSSARPSTLDQASELNARLETLADISKDQHRHLRDNTLRANNTAYQLFLNNAISDMEAPLTAAGLEKATKKAIATQEKAYASKLNAEFEDARLNVILDRTYAREMAYQLDVVQAMMRRVYNGTNSKELRGYLDSANTNLTLLSKSFDEFSDANISN